MIREAVKAFQLAKGYRLHPWDSPYLRWRIETWGGVDADSIDRSFFLKYVWENRANIRRYLKWACE